MLFKPAVAFLLAGTAYAAEMTAKESLLAQNIMAEVNMGTLEKNIKESVTQDIINMRLEAEIKAEVQKRVDAIVAEQIALGQKWDQLHKFEKEQWDEYEKLKMKQKLGSIFESMTDKSQLGEMWAGLTQDEVDKHLQKVSFTFDVQNKQITAVSNSTDTNGKPLFEWSVEPVTGQVQEIRRQPDASHERIVERTIDPADMNKQTYVKSLEEDKKAGQQLSEALTEANVHPDQAASENDDAILQREWDEAEAQRDIAFKIMYFFIAFIMCTFSLLYAYFKMVQQSELEAKMARRNKGLMDDKNIPLNHRETTFADFMTGQFDTNYIVNPYMRNVAQTQKPAQKQVGNNEELAAVGSVAKKALKIGAQSISIGLGMGTATLLQHYAEQQKKQGDVENRKTGEAFGSADLDHLSLEHRGRFPGINTDHFEFDADQPAESLISKDYTASSVGHLDTAVSQQ